MARVAKYFYHVKYQQPGPTGKTWWRVLGMTAGGHPQIIFDKLAEDIAEDAAARMQDTAIAYAQAIQDEANAVVVGVDQQPDFLHRIPSAGQDPAHGAGE